MRHLFIINPAAGKRDHTAEFTRQIEAHCAGLDYEIAVSKCAGDCTRIAREAADTGEEYRIYACGGDGTLNEVAAGAAGRENVAVTVFTGGSGNDFIKIFSRPEEFGKLDRLLDCREDSFDLIECNGNYAVNVCCVGLDSRVGTDVQRYKRLPGLSGSGAYLLSTLINVIRGMSEHFVVEVAGERIDAEQTMICVANGRYYGGGFNPVPEADPSDGLMDILLVKKLSRVQAAMVIGKYKDGRYKELPELVRHIRADRIRILFDKETPINLDGELRRATEAEIRISPNRLRFFYPKDLSWQTAVPV